MFRRKLLIAAAAGAVAVLACSRSSSPNLRELSVDEVAAKIAANDGKTLIYDCNSADRYKLGHLPGARHVEYDGLSAADLPADKGTMLVFYCASEL
jgi:rhodanese-related sulfurtransferase